MVAQFSKIIVLTYVRLSKNNYPENGTIPGYRFTDGDVSISKATLEQLNHPPIHLSTLRLFVRTSRTRRARLSLRSCCRSIFDKYPVVPRTYFKRWLRSESPVFLRYPTDGPRNENTPLDFLRNFASILRLYRGIEAVDIAVSGTESTFRKLVQTCR